MSFIDWFRPRWKRSNRTIRLNAVTALDRNAVRKLAKIARRDPDLEVSLAAIAKLTDQLTLAEIAVAEDPPETKHPLEFRVRQAAMAKVTDQELLAEIVKLDRFTPLRLDAAKRLSDQTVLGNVAQYDQDAAVRIAAADRLADRRLAQYAYLLITDGCGKAAPRLRLEAADKLNNISGYTNVAKDCEDVSVCMAALQKVTDQEFLYIVASASRHQAVRLAAAQELTDATVLLRFAKGKNPWDERVVAIERLTDQTALAKLARTADHWNLRLAAADKLADREFTHGVYGEFARKAKSDSWRLEVVDRLADQACLAEMALCDPTTATAIKAVERVTDADLLFKIACANRDWRCTVAVKQLTDPVLLSRIAKEAPREDARKAAVARVSDPALLADIARYYRERGNLDEAAPILNRLGDQVALAEIAAVMTFPSSEELALPGITDPRLLANLAMTKGFLARRAAAKICDERILADVAMRSQDRDARTAAVQKISDPALLADIAERGPAGQMEGFLDLVARPYDELQQVQSAAYSPDAADVARERLALRH